MNTNKHVNTMIQGKRFYNKALLSWYEKNHRNLPWRKTTNPYRILISEVMLQQTQVERVVDHYRRWLITFPTFETLARAKQQQVLTQWSGMGYNRRALNLHRCAKEVVKNYNGVLPSEYEQLLALPGIGPYTAGAIRAFAFKLPQAVIDTNIERIQHRFCIGPEVPEKLISNKEEWELAEALFPKRSKKYALWNHALMDIGALVCTKRNPQCQACPLQQRCASAQTIHEQLRAYYKTKKKSQEPGIEESGKYIPNRIFRGRVIEYLRNNKSASFENIGNAIKRDYTPYDASWLVELVEKLEEEKYIIVQSKGKVVKLR